MKPISNMLLCASFGVAMLAMGCAGTHTGGPDRQGSTDTPASTSTPSPASTSTPDTQSPSTPTSASPSSGPSSSMTSASSSNVGGTSKSTSRESFDTQRDTLDACLARIPSNSSDSQRMLATLTCERDARVRKPLDSVPGK